MEVVNLMKCLSDENRLKIASILYSDGTKCGCELLDELNISQSTLSHHMKILCECGLVNKRKDGRWYLYTIDKQKIDRLNEDIINFN